MKGYAMFYVDGEMPTNEEILDLAANANHFEGLVKDLVALEDMELTQELWEDMKYLSANMSAASKAFEFYKKQLAKKYNLK